MKNLNFPVNIVFKIGTLANDFYATDVNGHVVGYVRQKMFKFKEEVQVFTREDRKELGYTINADRWLDFSAAYSINNAQGQELGKLLRKGFRSLWSASYSVLFEGQKLYEINEVNPFIKFLDALLGEIPILGGVFMYWLNPSYVVTNNEGQEVYLLKKLPSVFGRKFVIEELTPQNEHDELTVLSLMMMILLERRRG